VNHWRWLARQFPRNPRGSQAQARLIAAYRSVFMPGGGATDEDKELVLADLANASGYYRVSGAGFSGEDRAFADGMRTTFGHALRFLLLSDDELRQLEEAARQEALADAQQDYNN
jgi:hypothetical protein